MTSTEEVKKRKAEQAKNYVETHREDYNAYQRKYQHKHMALLNARKREKFRILKAWAVDKLGRKCVDCGLVTKYDCVYDFHHTNEEESWARKGRKRNIIDWLRTKELIKWRKEDKIPDDVKLICSNCHRIRNLKLNMNVSS